MQPVRELLLREEPTSYPDPAREGPSNQGHLQFIATHGKGLLTLLVFLMHMPPPSPTFTSPNKRTPSMNKALYICKHTEFLPREIPNVTNIWFPRKKPRVSAGKHFFGSSTYNLTVLRPMKSTWKKAQICSVLVWWLDTDWNQLREDRISLAYTSR